MTSKLGQCQVKAENTRFATACLYKDVMRFMTRQKSNARDLTKLVADESHTHDIHEPPN